MPDGGTARADFPGGRASAVAQHPADPGFAREYAAIYWARLLPGRTREAVMESTIAQQRAEHSSNQSED